MSRSLEFDQAIADTICEEIADGRSLRSICKDEGMPAKSTVFKWLAAVPAFADQYARAREAQADSLADDILDISDNKSLEPNDRRIRIEARKWLAGKQRPKVYGDATTLKHIGPNGGPVEYTNMTEAEIDARLAALAGGSEPAPPTPED
ncbi:hypothetical protein [uncultured Brevundimonas sp.]|uniref:terminase small subunit-like protein n=1 Tax=uncultured Brevundimonas sp. TaxID=213418 RepID=UPI0025FF717D|nr:hypothetical protein [uncultured Brevundimonas sp.]